MTKKRFKLDDFDSEVEMLELINTQLDTISDLEKENEQLKQDNGKLIQLLENQSIIIRELRLKLMDYQLEKPIVLTKEDLEIMGKAISYYTHRGG